MNNIAKGKVQAKKFESVSILFTDFKGFTSYAENLAPEDLVHCVDYYFSKFDEIIEKHGVEKIALKAVNMANLMPSQFFESNGSKLPNLLKKLKTPITPTFLLLIFALELIQVRLLPVW